MKRVLPILALLAVAVVVSAPALACGQDKASQTAWSGHSSNESDVFYGVKGVTTTVNRIEGGIEILVASNDPSAIKKVEQRMESCPVKSGGCTNCPLKGESVERTIERTQNGLRIIAKAKSPEALKTLQAYGEMIAGNAKAADRG